MGTGISSGGLPAALAAANAGAFSFDVNINGLIVPFNTLTRLDVGWALIAPGVLQWTGGQLDHVELSVSIPLANAAGGLRKNPQARIEEVSGAVRWLATSSNQYLRNANGHTDPAIEVSVVDPTPPAAPEYRVRMVLEASAGIVSRVAGHEHEFSAKGVR